MRLVTVRAAEVVDARDLAEVAQAFQHRHTLAALLAWTASRSPRVHVVAIVTQDEYTRDVVLPFAATSLSFDTT